MGRKKPAAVEDTKLEDTKPEETLPEGVKQSRKPKAIDVQALRMLATDHEDVDAAQLLINRLDAYKEAERAFDEAKEVLDIAAGKVRTAAKLLD